MKNTKIRILSFILAAAMLTGCGASAESDSKAESSKPESSQVESSESRTEFETESTTSDSSETDSSALDDSSEDDSSDSSSDESSEATTTTKTSEESKTETEKTVTTTKQSSTTTSAVATQPVATRPTAQPVVTTKATQKPTVTAKQTTKATTKATTKVTNKQTADPTANLSPYYKALYRIGNGIASASDYETVRNELHKYGQSIAPTYTLDKSLTLYVTKNGKHTNYNEAGASYDDVTCLEPFQITDYGTKVSDLDYIDRELKRIIKLTLNYYDWKNANKYYKPTWYIQFGDISYSKKTMWLLCIASVE